MANINEAFNKVLNLEFSSPADALHYNSTEKGYTFMGIYEVAFPNWEGWRLVKQELNKAPMAKASSVLYYNQALQNLVLKFYKMNFWDKMRLDEVQSQKIAEELFVFAVNAGIPSAVRAAQKVINILADGILGSKTIAALNQADSKMFDVEYDKAEIAHYELLAQKNPTFNIYLKGWRNRALAV